MSPVLQLLLQLGLHANIFELSGGLIWITVLLTVAAIISKVLGSGLGARLGGFNNGESLRLGIGMLSRGEDVLPIFPSLGSLLVHQEIHHRTLFTVLSDGGDVEKLFDVTEAVVGPLDHPNNGIMFALPVVHARGLQRGRAAQ